MFCPVCKAEYRQGFARCADCEVELVESPRHASRVETPPPDKYGALLWQGEDPHFCLALVGWLGREVACYGKPVRPPRGTSDTDFGDESEPEGFQVWVAEADLARAKWRLETISTDYEENPPEHREAAKRGKNAEAGEPTGVCPLCFAEFASASSPCPNCNVPLHIGEIASDEDTGARLLCDLGHPQFTVELRRALQSAGIRFNNSSYSANNIVTGRFYVPNHEVLVLDSDFDRATRVMAQILQHWEFEPTAGFGPRQKPGKTSWPHRAAANYWQPEDLEMLLWSGANLTLVNSIGLALREHQVPYRVDDSEQGTAKIFIHPEDEAGAREILAQVVESVPPE